MFCQKQFEHPKLRWCAGDQRLIDVEDMIPFIPLDDMPWKRRPWYQREAHAPHAAIRLFSFPIVFRHLVLLISASEQAHQVFLSSLSLNLCKVYGEAD